MDDLLEVLRWTHIVAGCVGLLVFWMPVFAEKGGRVHKRFGRLFALCALYVSMTGLFFSIWALVHPASFFGDPEMKQISPEEVPLVIAQVRFLYSITGFLAIAVFSGVVLGMWLVRTHEKPTRRAGPALMTILSVYGLWSLGLVILGAGNLIAVLVDTHVLADAGGGRYWVSIILGAIGVFGAVGDIRYVCRPAPSPSSWLPKHMECMLGAGIGFHAAASFFLVNEVFGLELHGAMRFAPMLVPFVVGIPVMWWWSARWDRMTNDQRQAVA